MALLALVSSLLWGTADYLGGILTRRRPALVVVLAVQVVGLVAVGLVAVGSDSVRLGAGAAAAVAAGVAGAVALSAFYAALAAGTMGVVAPIAATGVAVPALVSWARGDRPATGAVAGMILAALGVVLASGLDPAGGVGRRRAPALAAVAAANFGSVLVLVDSATAHPGTSTLAVLTVMRLVAALALGALLALRRTPVRLGRGDAPAVVTAGLCDVAAVGLYALASEGDADLAVVAVLASLYPVVTALLARQLLQERLSRVQVTGVVAALGGVVLIASSGAAG